MINDNEKELLLQDLRRYLAAHYTPKKFTRGTPFLGAEISAATLDVRSLRSGGLTSATKNAILQGIRQMLRPGFRALLFELAKKKEFRTSKSIGVRISQKHIFPKSRTTMTTTRRRKPSSRSPSG